MCRILPPGVSKILLKIRKLPGGKARICYAGNPSFLNNFFIPEKLMPPDKANLAQTNGFKAFPGIRLGNPLIQSQSPADFRVFPIKQSRYPCRMLSSDSSPPSFSPVTHREHPCAGFKTWLGKMYHGAGISARWADVERKHCSPNPPILPGSKSVQVKVWVA